MSLQGGPQLKARMKAIRLTFKAYGRVWADGTAEEMRRHVPVATGRLQGSIRRKSATQKRATVVGHYSANFVGGGSKAHDILPKKGGYLIFEAEGQTIFARKVHKQRIAARPFKREAALEELRKHPMSKELIDLWNKAA